MAAPWPQRHHRDGTLALIAPELAATTIRSLATQATCTPVALRWDDPRAGALLEAAFGLLDDGQPAGRAVAGAELLCT